MSTVQFNATYLSIVKDLTAISPGIIFNKDGDKIVITRTNKGRSIFFKLEAPLSYFEFEGDKIAFYNFAEFYQLLNAFGAAKLSQKDNKLIIESSIGKINYFLSAPETLTKSPSKINISDPDIIFNLSQDGLAQLKKVDKLMNIKYSNISYTSGAVTFRLFNNIHDNSFERIYTPETISFPDLKDFEFPIYSEIFSKLISEIDYKVSIFNKGFIFFACKKEEIDLLAVTSRVKKIGENENDGTEAGTEQGN